MTNDELEPCQWVGWARGKWTVVTATTMTEARAQLARALRTKTWFDERFLSFVETAAARVKKKRAPASTAPTRQADSGVDFSRYDGSGGGWGEEGAA